MVVSLVWMDGSLCDMAGGVELVAPHNSTYEPFFVFCTWNTANTHTKAQSKMNNSWPVKWCVVVTALRPSKPKQLCNGPCAAQYPFRYVFFFVFCILSRLFPSLHLHAVVFVMLPLFPHQMHQAFHVEQQDESYDLNEAMPCHDRRVCVYARTLAITHTQTAV